MNDLTTLENLSVNFEPGTIDFPQAQELKKLVADKLEQTKGLVATDEALRQLRHHALRSTSLKRQSATSANSTKGLGTCRLNSSRQRSERLKAIATVRHKNSN